ncbi:O-antigen ligase family protein [Clostridium cylindrosporum]|uniref:Polymerase n=1 Tax=Clostridium cylindrosporum DSM 605 TaxID=1121307 RepID=A0A0J8G4L1_CLOCY|nr:O-antigen ligase family protein [Clostridium cylindrosporum]KMT22606.1 polymerase [Clostridium cylindrosporum DSM 605]
MKLKNILNIILYTFIIIVPLVPVKTKISFIPIAADTVFGGLAILFGIAYISLNCIKDRSYLNVVKSKEMKFLGVLAVLFTIISLSSVFYAQNKVAAITETIRFIEYVVIFYIILIVSDNDFIKKSLSIFYIVMIIASLFGVVQFIFNLSGFYDNGTYHPLGRGRIYSTFENPNYWGAAINMVIFYPIICFVEKRGSRLLNGLVFLLFLFNLIFSSTRGSWLGFGLGLLVISILRYRRMLLSIPALIVAALILPATRQRFLSIFDPHNASEGVRVKIWKTGLEMFKDYPLLGVGNGNFLFRYREYISKYHELYAGRTIFTTHNSYIKMLAELGAIGGVLFILIYASLTHITFKVYRYTKRYNLVALSFIGFWCAYLFQNFLNNLMFIPQLNVLVWIITAMLYKGYYIESKKGVANHG